jgi:hypothetical protein
MALLKEASILKAVLLYKPVASEISFKESSRFLEEKRRNIAKALSTAATPDTVSAIFSSPCLLDFLGIDSLC